MIQTLLMSILRAIVSQVAILTCDPWSPVLVIAAIQLAVQTDNSTHEYFLYDLLKLIRYASYHNKV